MSNTIKIQLRVRPPGANPAMQFDPNEKPLYNIDYNDEVMQLVGANQNYNFKFNHIFDAKSTQEEVYDHLVKPMMGDFLAGFNCCVFCYGQTGSGKTYTQTGGNGSYNDRGLMPRALEQLFQQIELSKDRNFDVYLSYAQILNEGGFDLLSQSGQPVSGQRTHEQLARIQLLESEANVIRVRNLSAFPATSVEEALNVLWNGDMNRLVTATSQNQSSTRSHCIFTINLHSRPNGSEVIRKSKFHFVDLAGSERVSQTGSEGLILSQARYINVSLFHLETVIQALARAQKDPSMHVPYRNSLMTLYLKDSLGGNCKTAMLATVAVEQKNIPESISTCQFAMQVGSISNLATINEEIDPKLLIQKLKQENKLLKEELKLLKEGEGANCQKDLSPEEEEDVKQKVREFLADTQKQTLDVGSWFRLQFAIRYMRQLYNDKQGGPSSPTTAQPLDENELTRLKKILQQRDAEIDILTQMVGGDQPKPQPHQAKHAGPMYDYDNIDTTYESQNGSTRELKFVPESESTPKSRPQSASKQQQTAILDRPVAQNVPDSVPRPPVKEKKLSEAEQYLNILSSAGNICKIDLSKLSLNQLKNEEQVIFAQFQSKYYNAERLNSDKETLQTLYKDAKLQANSIIQLKSQAEKMKTELLQLVQKLGSETEETDFIKEQLQKVNSEYQLKVRALKETQVQLKSVEADLNVNKDKMKKDFIRWYQYAVQYLQNQQPAKIETHKKGAGSIDQEIDDEIQAFYNLKKKAGM
ncbi:Kinesin-like_protein [Hexamita inflata]|uniref:Kinesin-like protein n=1 Tax=Hexamita inflata TaxID=28002 RepID=A0AA86QAJ6_9EUKA|nr:Kinesin-like protein [Hexamita inflata]